MSYSRRTVTDGVTKMNKDLYDNLQDGIDEAKQDISGLSESIANAKKEHEVIEKKFDGYVATEKLADEVKQIVISGILVV